MMEFLSKAIDTILQNSDPMLSLCVLLLGFWSWRNTQAIKANTRLVEDHLTPDRQYPHAACRTGGQAFRRLFSDLKLHRKEMTRIHMENRQDHQIIFSLLRGQPVSQEFIQQMDRPIMEEENVEEDAEADEWFPEPEEKP